MPVLVSPGPCMGPGGSNSPRLYCTSYRKGLTHTEPFVDARQCAESFACSVWCHYYSDPTRLALLFHLLYKWENWEINWQSPQADKKSRAWFKTKPQSETQAFPLVLCCFAFYLLRVHRPEGSLEWFTFLIMQKFLEWVVKYHKQSS